MADLRSDFTPFLLPEEGTAGRSDLWAVFAAAGFMLMSSENFAVAAVSARYRLISLCNLRHQQAVHSEHHTEAVWQDRLCAGHMFDHLQGTSC